MGKALTVLFSPGYRIGNLVVAARMARRQTETTRTADAVIWGHPLPFRTCFIEFTPFLQRIDAWETA